MSNNNQIPTAYEFLHRDESGVFNEVDITQAMEEYAKLHVEQIKQFLYSEICERREYSASRMCEEVLKFINQINGGDNTGENNGMMNNIPDTNTNTTGNISDNRWTRTLTNDRTVFETDLWNKTVNWDKMNQPNVVSDEEQAPYNVKTNVVTSGKTDDGTLATIEITIDIKQR